ncbi:MAG: hypothetical protein WC393_03165 [Candidatus Nanoarchaeia archaeon]|jgi:hypothetical protein
MNIVQTNEIKTVGVIVPENIFSQFCGLVNKYNSLGRDVPVMTAPSIGFAVGIIDHTQINGIKYKINIINKDYLNGLMVSAYSEMCDEIITKESAQKIISTGTMEGLLK